MAYYFNVLALCVGAALCFVLGRALFDVNERAPAPASVISAVDPGLPRVVRADACQHPRK
ncbi:hypothetical protein [Corallococcus sp. EGB]|uniref:hypothetical protein n=1 Tax=Corallococcus sp. EGB TaxID=1521117 RepID=UPI001CBFC646|nr:hypothetical protein [Corallococcus sp. EGB]